LFYGEYERIQNFVTNRSIHCPEFNHIRVIRLLTQSKWDMTWHWPHVDRFSLFFNMFVLLDFVQKLYIPSFWNYYPLLFLKCYILFNDLFFFRSAISFLQQFFFWGPLEKKSQQNLGNQSAPACECILNSFNFSKIGIYINIWNINIIGSSNPKI
jgi:hypothetical protein